MSKKKAKLIYKHNSFDVIEEGDYVLCAVSRKEIMLKNLNYWNVELQEAYFSPREVNERYGTKDFLVLTYTPVSSFEKKETIRGKITNDEIIIINKATIIIIPKSITGLISDITSDTNATIVVRKV